MPRYAYECFECGHTVEKIEGWSAEARQPCDQCDAVMQRIPSPPAILFKGSGWYSTDHRKSSWKNRGDEDSSDGDGSDGDGDASGDGGDSGSGDGDSSKSGATEKAPAASGSASD